METNSQTAEVIRHIKYELDLDEQAKVLIIGENGLYLAQVEEIKRGHRRYRTFSYEHGTLIETAFVAAA